jgi:hypothetical protein
MCDSERCPVCNDQIFLCGCIKQPAVPVSPIFMARNN